MSRSRKPPDDDDRTLFREAMRDVQPLAPTAAKLPRAPRSKPPPRPARPESIPIPTRQPPPTADGSGVQARLLQRLRRGRLRPEATLDLHGLNRHQAHLEVARFLATAQAAGRRCVLLIHGIGRGDDRRGVLRETVPAWLADHPEVLASAPAQPADGGAGACYVLLRRPRRPPAPS
jgi:DNA-nicking Smr family endonuclease